MAKSRSKRITLKDLIKKIELLENQGFAQKLVIDELESKLQRAEDTIKSIKDNPFGFTSGGYVGMPVTTPVSPLTPRVHVCQGSLPDYLGNTYCIICCGLMSSVTYTMGTYTLPVTIQSSSDVQSISEDIDISGLLPDDSSK